MRIASTLILTVLLVGCGASEPESVLIISVPLEESTEKIPPKKKPLKLTIQKSATLEEQAEKTRKIVREGLREKRKGEIPAFQYMVVEGWVQLYPEVREKVKTMLSDDEIITWDEYKVLDNFVSGDLADRQAEKVRDDWKNRIKSHIENSSR